jgi:hypothetical protein
MNYAFAMRRDGWWLSLSLSAATGMYMATARRSGDRVTASGADPDGTYRRLWESAELLHPTFECDTCGRATSDLRELVSLNNAQVCGECYVMEEAAEYHAREADHA